MAFPGILYSTEPSATVSYTHLNITGSGKLIALSSNYSGVKWKITVDGSIRRYHSTLTTNEVINIPVKFNNSLLLESSHDKYACRVLYILD